jgi:predicted membrane protein
MKKLNNWKISFILVVIWLTGGVIYRLSLNNGVHPAIAEGEHRLVWLIALIVSFILSFKGQIGSIAKKWFKFVAILIIWFFLPATVLAILFGAIFTYLYLRTFETYKLHSLANKKIKPEV